MTERAAPATSRSIEENFEDIEIEPMDKAANESEALKKSNQALPSGKSGRTLQAYHKGAKQVILKKMDADLEKLAFKQASLTSSKGWNGNHLTYDTETNVQSGQEWDARRSAASATPMLSEKSEHFQTRTRTTRC